MQSKDRCSNQKIDATKEKEKYLINKQLEYRCIKMRMSIYTKQIGNCLNNLVLAKTGTSIYENPLKGNSKKSHSSHKK